MNKTNLIDEISGETGVSKKIAGQVLDSTVNQITQALSQGDEVTLIGFGTFISKQRPERDGRNPKTGEPIKIKAARVPSFRPGKALKEAVAEA